MCNCANRMKRILQSEGFRWDRKSSMWVHPNGESYSDHYVNNNHTMLFAKWAKNKVTGKYAEQNQG